LSSTSEDILQKLKGVLEDALGDPRDFQLGEYPKEGLPVGTISRSNIHNRLCVIVDAFYGDLDEDNQKIIIYTVLLFPERIAFGKNSSQLSENQYYLSNEYEYDIIGYLMIPPVNLENFSHILGSSLL